MIIIVLRIGRQSECSKSGSFTTWSFSNLCSGLTPLSPAISFPMCAPSSSGAVRYREASWGRGPGSAHPGGGHRSRSEGGGSMAKDRQLGACQPSLEDSLGWDGWKGFRGRRGAGLGIKIVRGKEFELSSGVCEF